MMAQQDATRELRSVEQRRSPQAFETIPVLSGDRIRLQLGDIAIIRQEARDNQTVMENEGLPAVELQLQRAENGNSLAAARVDRKSTRLNSSHVRISYAVFCLKKKKKKRTTN